MLRIPDGGGGDSVRVYLSVYLSVYWVLSTQVYPLPTSVSILYYKSIKLDRQIDTTDYAQHGFGFVASPLRFEIRQV